jgi:hypothetical protein
VGPAIRFSPLVLIGPIAAIIITCPLTNSDANEGKLACREPINVTSASPDPTESLTTVPILFF